MGQRSREASGPRVVSCHHVSDLTRQARQQAAKDSRLVGWESGAGTGLGAGSATKCPHSGPWGSDRVGARAIRFVGRPPTGSVGNGKVRCGSPVPAGPVAGGQGDSGAADGIPPVTLHPGRAGQAYTGAAAVGGGGKAGPMAGAIPAPPPKRRTTIAQGRFRSGRAVRESILHCRMQSGSFQTGIGRDSGSGRGIEPANFSRLRVNAIAVIVLQKLHSWGVGNVFRSCRAASGRR